MFSTSGSRSGRKASGWSGIFQGYVLVGDNVSINTSAFLLGANVKANTTVIVVGNVTVNTTGMAVGANVVVNVTTIAVGAVVENTSSVAVGANVVVSTTSLSIGNSTVNVFANSSLWQTSNSTGIANLNPISLTIGTSIVNTTSVYVGGNNVLLSNTSNNIGAGFTITAFNAGTKSSGTFTPDPTKANYQYFQSNGAFTLATPASDCAIDLLANNGTGAGTITFSGYTVGSTGDALDTTSSHKFLIMIRRINGLSTYVIKALQ